MAGCRPSAARNAGTGPITGNRVSGLTRLRGDSRAFPDAKVARGAKGASGAVPLAASRYLPGLTSPLATRGGFDSARDGLGAAVARGGATLNSAFSFS